VVNTSELIELLDISLVFLIVGTALVETDKVKEPRLVTRALSLGVTGTGRVVEIIETTEVCTVAGAIIPGVVVRVIVNVVSTSV